MSAFWAVLFLINVFVAVATAAISHETYLGALPSAGMAVYCFFHLRNK